MTRRSFFLALAATALFWGAGAMEARATQMPLSALLGQTVDIDGLYFTFVTYSNPTGNAPASDVTVTYPAPGTNMPGFNLTGNFGAGPGQFNDSDLVYTVTAPPGVSITDAELAGNPSASGTGLASVSETLRSGTSVISPIIVPITGTNPMLIASYTPPGPGPVEDTFAPQSQITVTKDWETSGGTDGIATLSSITQVFSVSGSSVPEPSSMALLGIGMASFMAFRRFIRRTPQA
jgi:hypothetical protein